jgi:5'-nucleotidase (lipoprotein e(P4) family)
LYRGAPLAAAAKAERGVVRVAWSVFVRRQAFTTASGDCAIIAAMTHTIFASAVFLCLAGAAPALAQQATTPRELAIKYVRDSEEYATLARQVYRMAGEAVRRAAAASTGRPWVVVLDVDETALDNSAYQLERAAYGLPFDTTSWNAWVERQEARAVPGVIDFIKLVRSAGGRVAWISNRDARVANPTRANLEALGLWDGGDRMCAQKTPQHTKAARRHEIIAGRGDCAWKGTPMQVVAFVGDQLGDFPGDGEKIPQTGTDAAFGQVCFLLPNPMYGGWTTAVTRRTGVDVK